MEDKNTIDYYDNNANTFANDTLDVKFADVQNRFLSYIPNGGLILDFGCGAGRDTKYFLSNGYMVDAIDGSEKLCEIASRNTGINVKQMLFSELDSDAEFDGIWACSSILHLKKSELKTVFEKMIKAIKADGVIYSSFKYGDFEGYRNERYFTDFSTDTFHEFVRGFPQITIIEEWVSSDVRPGRGDEKWLNVIVQKR